MAVTGSVCCLLVIPEWSAGLRQAAQIHNAPDPWSKEAVLHALEHWKRKRRTVEEEEDQRSAAAQEDKRRPGPLKRGLSSQSSDGELRKRPLTSAVSSLTSTCTCGVCMSSRSAITSSYTSTGGISQLRKRRPSASTFSSPASSCSQTPERPAKKIREEDVSQESGSSAPLVDKESQGEQAPLPGHSITTEDYDRQKQAQSQWLKRDFEDKTETASNSDSVNPPATPPASTLALPAAGTAASSASPQAPMTNPLFLPKYIIFLKKPNPLGLPSFPGTSTPTFGQNTPDPGVGASGSSLSSAASSAPAQGFARPGTFDTCQYLPKLSVKKTDLAKTK
ncbi:hypothetical protein MUG91_G83n17 [Manis pentadactyla]|nr:hypothetical protein MUG91_G83n17 [Manis pentadactyla]